MPELPEVQTIADDLSRSIIGRKIISVWSDLPKNKLPNLAEIRGATVRTIDRRGKNILIYLSKNKDSLLLLVHPRMTGHFLLGRWMIPKSKNGKIKPAATAGPLAEKVNSYVHLVFTLSGGEMLGLSDARKFSRIVFGKAERVEKLNELKKLGPDALSPQLTAASLKKIILKKNRPIKAVLLDQTAVAGIGNIYSDEILWLARISPLKTSSKLKDAEARKIYSAMRAILKKAVRLRGTSFSDFRDVSGSKGGYGEKRLIYGLAGHPCRRCGSAISKIKISGRTASFCPLCQR
ncbi:MAG: bifunctional DNA-formamidopyrimidine glycosylase/DNA-(apurinic or apyrimidinic site) lyase [Patescibacteria group bacterium]|nr:bifunctional DNA-formamidopyrimidine glycosylase/DNA-(apurinic or apyrimidinic site) lyase [Patescibacteria group bacterium]